VPAPSVHPFGVYVHVPYCVSRCPYCDFNAWADPSPPWRDYGRAVAAEISTRGAAFGGLALESVYVGGGTPSLAPPETLAEILAAVVARFGPLDDCEVTLEANPKTIEVSGFEAARRLGFNRASVGWQSTDDRLLEVLGRGHSAADSAACARAAREAGFDNLSIDLIFAVPGQTAEDLERDLDAIETLAPEHVSLYALTYHAGTEMERRLRAGTIERISEEAELAMMIRIEERLGAAGFEHYEVSNYARPGRRSVHNSLTWIGAPYLGAGPGAHSFAREATKRGWRWESVRSPALYLQAWTDPQPAGRPRADDPTVSFVEDLTPRQMMTERMLGGMRMPDGVDLNEPLLAGFGREVRDAAVEAHRRGWLSIEGARLRPTAEGLRNADALAEIFF
jgi:oxygen-independent coproporphyrinogen-3 oxidase